MLNEYFRLSEQTKMLSLPEICCYGALYIISAVVYYSY